MANGGRIVIVAIDSVTSLHPKRYFKCQDARSKSNKNNVNKTLGTKVSFQRECEDSQRWAATDRVGQTVPGARCCDGEGAVAHCCTTRRRHDEIIRCRLAFPSLLPFCHTFSSPSLTVLLSYKSSCAVGLGSAVDGYAQSSAALPSNGIWTWCTGRAIFSYRIDVDSLIFMSISRLAADAGCSGRRGQQCCHMTF